MADTGCQAALRVKFKTWLAGRGEISSSKVEYLSNAESYMASILVKLTIGNATTIAQLSTWLKNEGDVVRINDSRTNTISIPSWPLHVGTDLEVMAMQDIGGGVLSAEHPCGNINNFVNIWEEEINARITELTPEVVGCPACPLCEDGLYPSMFDAVRSKNITTIAEANSWRNNVSLPLQLELPSGGNFTATTQFLQITGDNRTDKTVGIVKSTYDLTGHIIGKYTDAENNISWHDCMLEADSIVMWNGILDDKILTLPPADSNIVGCPTCPFCEDNLYLHFKSIVDAYPFDQLQLESHLNNVHVPSITLSDGSDLSKFPTYPFLSIIGDERTNRLVNPIGYNYDLEQHIIGRFSDDTWHDCASNAVAVVMWNEIINDRISTIPPPGVTGCPACPLCQDDLYPFLANIITRYNLTTSEQFIARRDNVAITAFTLTDGLDVSGFSGDFYKITGDYRTDKSIGALGKYNYDLTGHVIGQYSDGTFHDCATEIDAALMWNGILMSQMSYLPNPEIDGCPACPFCQDTLYPFLRDVVDALDLDSPTKIESYRDIVTMDDTTIHDTVAWTSPIAGISFLRVKDDVRTNMSVGPADYDLTGHIIGQHTDSDGTTWQNCITGYDSIIMWNSLLDDKLLIFTPGPDIVSCPACPFCEDDLYAYIVTSLNKFPLNTPSEIYSFRNSKELKDVIGEANLSNHLLLSTIIDTTDPFIYITADTRHDKALNPDGLIHIVDNILGMHTSTTTGLVTYHNCGTYRYWTTILDDLIDTMLLPFAPGPDITECPVCPFCQDDVHPYFVDTIDALNLDTPKKINDQRHIVALIISTLDDETNFNDWGTTPFIQISTDSRTERSLHPYGYEYDLSDHLLGIHTDSTGLKTYHDCGLIKDWVIIWDEILDELMLGFPPDPGKLGCPDCLFCTTQLDIEIENICSSYGPTLADFDAREELEIDHTPPKQYALDGIITPSLSDGELCVITSDVRSDLSKPHGINSRLMPNTLLRYSAVYDSYYNCGSVNLFMAKIVEIKRLYRILLFAVEPAYILWVYEGVLFDDPDQIEEETQYYKNMLRTVIHDEFIYRRAYIYRRNINQTIMLD